jgi:hypothetical protein
VWVMVAEDLSVLNATLLNVLHPFNVFVCLYFVVCFYTLSRYIFGFYLYLLVNLSNESNFY